MPRQKCWNCGGTGVIYTKKKKLFSHSYDKNPCSTCNGEGGWTVRYTGS